MQKPSLDNEIYELIVDSKGKGERLLIQLMAYSKYKEVKKQIVKEYFQKNHRYPSSEFVRAIFYKDETIINNLVELANEEFKYVLARNISKVIETKKEEYEHHIKLKIEELNNQYRIELSKLEKGLPRRKSFFYFTPLSTVGVLLIFFLILIIWFFGFFVGTL
ncbi:hypothetical protein QQ008_08995 [Fulvivirgaceae bacterium BMA10]|uniref:Uncharacterized protein n=1 Tax=Splendidivirga corallicola TaxID=3051826 RepID=A0ABT8KN84_9BACT|nr:hypothetical protein [Fulvivirgaceae bacterium BMA10]